MQIFNREFFIFCFLLLHSIGGWVKNDKKQIVCFDILREVRVWMENKIPEMKIQRTFHRIQSIFLTLCRSSSVSLKNSSYCLLNCLWFFILFKWNYSEWKRKFCQWFPLGINLCEMYVDTFFLFRWLYFVQFGFCSVGNRTFIIFLLF